jgi:hypothetical protein
MVYTVEQVDGPGCCGPFQFGQSEGKSLGASLLMAPGLVRGFKSL